jgi:hypothetical protein
MADEWKTISRRDKKTREIDRLHAPVNCNHIAKALRQGCCLRFGPENSIELYIGTPPDKLSTDLRRTCLVRFPRCSWRTFDHVQLDIHPLSCNINDNYLTDDNFISITRFIESLTAGVFITTSPKANCFEVHERPPRTWEYRNRPTIFVTFENLSDETECDEYEVESPPLEATGSIDDFWE